MLKITVNGKELKEIIEKSVCNMNKKTPFSYLRSVTLESKDGYLRAITTDIESYLDVRTDNYTCNEDGKIGISCKDLKVITKMTGWVDFTEQENCISIKNGKRNINITKVDISDFPAEPKEEFIPKVQMEEIKLMETLNNLSTFLLDGDGIETFQCFNFNLSDSRIEILDGYRIGMRRIEESEKLSDGSFMLHGKVVTGLKKTFNKKSTDNVTISVGKNNVKISGKNFTYYIRMVKGDYFKVNYMLNVDSKTKCTIDRENALETVKYYAENVIPKRTKTPLVFRIFNGKIETYSFNERMEVADEIENNNFYGKDLTIGFNPYYVLDALKIADSDDVKLELINPKAPMMIKAETYSFLVLPVNLTESNVVDRMEKYYSAA